MKASLQKSSVNRARSVSRGGRTSRRVVTTVVSKPTVATSYSIRLWRRLDCRRGGLDVLSALETGPPGVTTEVDVDGHVAFDPEKLLEQAAGVSEEGTTLV